MSSYLGWKERAPPKEFDTTRFDRDILPGGEVSAGYENYVRSIFRPTIGRNPEMPVQLGPSSTPLPAGASALTGNPKVSASQLLKMEEHLGKDALDDSNDHNLFDDDPLIDVYMGTWPAVAFSTTWISKLSGSAEYNAIRSSVPNPLTVSGNYRGSFRSYKQPEEQEKSWHKTDRQTLIDYQQFERSPLSPYLYLEHPYVRSQDSRIVGSNFVQLTTRPKDSFLEKIDRTLAEVRAMPRF
ncbi:hypothetical protein M3Y97_00885100 [Aphelenchoides bicaudatus]|nr:hypothetical protein M3Y97_00885100 [Aphelenchoides bicaudatus]